MNFDLTTEQEIIRNSVRKFAETEIAPVALELDEKEEFSAELTKKWEKSVSLECLQEEPTSFLWPANP